MADVEYTAMIVGQMPITADNSAVMDIGPKSFNRWLLEGWKSQINIIAKPFPISITPNKILVPSAQSVGKGQNGFIRNKVLEQGNPVSRRVICLHRSSGLFVDQTWSDKNGVYEFNNLEAGVKYILLSIDENNDGKQWNVVGQDLVEAEKYVIS